MQHGEYPGPPLRGKREKSLEHNPSREDVVVTELRSADALEAVVAQLHLG